MGNLRTMEMRGALHSRVHRYSFARCLDDWRASVIQSAPLSWPVTCHLLGYNLSSISPL